MSFIVEQRLPIMILVLSQFSVYVHYVKVSLSVHPPASVINNDPTECGGNLRLLGLSVFMPGNASYSTDTKKTSKSPVPHHQHAYP